MTVNGVKVIVQPSGNEIVQVLTVLKGGVQNYPADKAGIEDLALTAILECGTKNDSKNSFKNKLDKISAYIGEDTGSGLFHHQPELYQELISTRSGRSMWTPLPVPLFDSVEFDRMKQDDINSINDQASGPDFAIAQLALKPHLKERIIQNPNGEMKERLVKWGPPKQKTIILLYLTRSRLLIVVVAELEKEEIEKMVKKLTENIPEGKPVILNRYSYSPSKNTFTSQNKAVATNYIMGITSAPMPGSEDYNAFAIAMRIYYFKNAIEIRTNYGLSYAPAAFMVSGLSPYTRISVSTKNPDKFIEVNNKLLEKTHAQGFGAVDVKNAKTGFVTAFYSKMETNAAQAASLASNEILFNDWRRSLRINDDMKKVTSEEVTKSFNKYVKDFSWAFQGDTSKVNPSLYTAMPVNQKLPETKVSGNKN